MAPRFSIIPGRAVTDRRLSDAQLRVLVAVGVHTDRDGWCEFSQGRLAERLEVSRQFINKTIAQLVELRYLDKRERHRSDGAQTISEYRVLHDVEDETCQRETTGGATSEDYRGVQPQKATGGATSEGDSNNVSFQRLKKEKSSKDRKNDLFEDDRRQRRSKLPPDCPTAKDRNAALAYWRSKDRDDLCPSVDRSADKFRAYHEGKGTLAADWSATWRTWYVNQIDMVRPPLGTQRAPQATVADETDAIWMRRLESRAKGVWIPAWGGEPGSPDCRVPSHVLARFRAGELKQVNQ